MGTVVRVILASYPMWWKERYGTETADLTEDLLADGDARRLRVLVNLAVGSVLGVIDGWRGSPFLATFPPTMVLAIAFSLLLDLVFLHGSLRFSSVQLVMWSAMLVVTLVGKVLTSSATITIAVTSNGLAVFRMGMFTRRTGSLVMRLPAAPPSVVRTGASKFKVDLGGPRFWVTSRSMPLIRWMGGQPGDVRGRTSPA